MPAGLEGNVPRANQVTSTEAIVDAAAKKWGIPGWVLWGVYGMETDFGANVTTSSAGAVGSFQFLPSTAASYGYPVSNATDTGTFTAQADAAAHYLSDLFKRTGSWNSALESYSGGGYGEAQVQAKGGTKAITASKIPLVGPVIGAAESAASTASDTASAIGDIFTWLTTPSNWLKILKFIGGAVLVFLALKELTGAQTPQVVKTAAAAAMA